MTTNKQQFQQRVREAIQNERLQIALDNNAARRQQGTRKSFESLHGEYENLRERARAIRWDVVRNLDSYRIQFVKNLMANGIQVHFATDGKEAVDLCLKLAEESGASLIAKAKSMVAEEIHFNRQLENSGLRVVETDLGEFIVQLRGESPAHIITPAVHLRKEDVAQLFNNKFGMPVTNDVKVMTEVARKQLRQVFLTADIGVSGVNFGVAESGTVVLLTNEGNGRMVTTMPRIHIALMGMERLVPTLDDLMVMLKLLPRSATGQKLTSYVSMIRSARQYGDLDGPEVRHVVIIDNQRSKIAEGPLAEALLCIRCGACLNACPVFQEIGGHTYQSAYPGPIGSIISPGLFGVEQFGHLAKASTLCGACMDACPVKIDFPTLLLRVRDEYTQKVSQPGYLHPVIRIYAFAMQRPRLYSLGQKMAALAMSAFDRRAGWVRGLPPPANAWTATRDFPPFAARPFRDRWAEINGKTYQTNETESTIPRPNAREAEGLFTEPATRLTMVEEFKRELTALGGEFIECTPYTVNRLIGEKLEKAEIKTIIAKEGTTSNWQELAAHIRHAGATILSPDLMERNPARQQGMMWLSQAEAGLTEALGACAESGTLVQASGKERSQLASLLAPIHIAILEMEQIYPTIEMWLKAQGKNLLANEQNVTLISGPSRTADIEMTLTTGVHGPGQLWVFGVRR